MAAITKCIDDQRSPRHLINPSPMHFHLIAAEWSKKKLIPFDVKASRRKKDVIPWLDEHCQIVASRCLIQHGGIESIFQEFHSWEAVWYLSDSSDE
jgi:hypothetical protein